MPKILVVEDDHDLAEMVVSWLENERYTVEHAEDGRLAQDLLKLSNYDVVVLDWDLPHVAGIEVLKEFRSNGGQTPIIMLTGKGGIDDKERGLVTGADDYLTKPFAIRELGARVKALLRRPASLLNSNLTCGALQMDPTKHRVTVSGTEVHLLPRDFALLEFLMRHKDEVFSAEALISRVWSSDSDASPEGLRTAIKRIRKKIDTGGDESASMIENIPKIGYRLRSN